MMNSKFVAERSRSLAQKILQTENDDAARVGRAWRTVLGREPTRQDIESAMEYVRRFPSDKQGSLLSWSSFCRALIASNDFIYVH
jgi:hypothetical protein